MLDVPGAAAFLAVPVSRIRYLVHMKRVPFYRIGASVRFKAADLAEMVERGRVEGVNGPLANKKAV